MTEISSENAAPETPIETVDGTKSALQAIPEQVLETILEALKDLPEVSGLNDEHLKSVACDAFLEDKLHEEEWVISEIVKLKTKVLLEGNQEGEKDLIQIDKVGPISIGSQEELELAIEEHQNWMDAVLHPRKPIISGRANFTGANLSKMDLSKVNLSCADFTDCNLSEANLSHGNFSKAIFRGADLSHANLDHGKFKLADFSSAILPEEIPETANFLKAKMPRKKSPGPADDEETVPADITAIRNQESEPTHLS